MLGEARSTFLAVVKGDVSQAVSEFKKLDGTVTKATTSADSSVGKFRTGVKGMASELMTAAASPAGLATAVGAAATFAIKAANDYSKLGVEVGKFADATGLATEDASRWVEVAGDLNVSADSLRTSIGRLNKNIDPDTFRDLGIQIARTATGATDVNGTFLNVVDALKRMKDPAQRAQVATKLLGKGWQEISEIIGMGSSGLSTRLASVAEVKVFTKSETEQARAFRDTMQNLSDLAQELALKIGREALPMVEDLAGAFLDLADAYDAIPDFVKVSPYAEFKKAIAGSVELEAAVGKLADQEKAASFTIEEVNDARRGGTGITHKYVDAVISAEDALRKEWEATRNLINAERDLDNIRKSAIDATVDSWTAYNDAQKALTDYNETVADSESTLLDQKSAAIDVAVAMTEASAKIAESNGHTQTASEKAWTMAGALGDLARQLDPKSPLRQQLETYIQDLLRVPENIKTSLSISDASGRPTTSNSAARGPDGEPIGVQVAGRPVTPAYGRGPDGGRNPSVTGGVTNYITINTKADPNDVITVIKQYVRSGGRGVV